MGQYRSIPGEVWAPRVGRLWAAIDRVVDGSARGCTAHYSHSASRWPAMLMTIRSTMKPPASQANFRCETAGKGFFNTRETSIGDATIRYHALTNLTTPRNPWWTQTIPNT